MPSPPGWTTGGSRRFSSTVRLAKMPRSSGQNASPSRAIRFDGRPISSRPPSRTEPRRRATMPMIDLSVVVLPAPLRPRSVTVSPGMISKSTPCRMCDSPYYAWRSRTSSSGSGMARPHVGLDHLGTPRHGPIVALGEDLAARQDGDGVREVLDHAEVVLDHQDGPVRRDALDQGRDPL